MYLSNKKKEQKFEAGVKRHKEILIKNAANFNHNFFSELDCYICHSKSNEKDHLLLVF